MFATDVLLVWDPYPLAREVLGDATRPDGIVARKLGGGWKGELLPELANATHSNQHTRSVLVQWVALDVIEDEGSSLLQLLPEPP